MENKYASVCKEVLAALDKVPNIQLKVIPYYLIEHLKEESEKSTEEIQLKFDMYGNPILSREAKSMIVLIYQKYFLNDQSRQMLTQKLYQNNQN